MKPFQRVTGTALPLERADIDTDAIIPQRWLITTERAGLGVGLFSNWRYREETFDPDPTFVMNEPRFAGAKIIVAGPNYGCGSSREHAVWAHLDYGIQAIVSSSFGPIFYDNALKNGLLPVVLDQAIVEGIITQLLSIPMNKMGVDLESCVVTGPDGLTFSFPLEEQRRSALLAGQDEIAATLELREVIADFQVEDRLRNPWIWSL